MKIRKKDQIEIIIEIISLIILSTIILIALVVFSMQQMADKSESDLENATNLKNHLNNIEEHLNASPSGLTPINKDGKDIIFYDPNLLKYQPVICTESMEPTLNCNDVILMKLNPKKSELKKQDIILFQRLDNDCKHLVENAYTMHRIIGVDYHNGDVMFTTRGDNNREPDFCNAPYGTVLAKVVAIVKDAWHQ